MKETAETLSLAQIKKTSLFYGQKIGLLSESVLVTSWQTWKVFEFVLMEIIVCHRYRVFGDPPSQRTAEDLAFSVAHFFSKNGSLANYYMVCIFKARPLSS